MTPNQDSAGRRNNAVTMITPITIVVRYVGLDEIDANEW